MTKSVVKPERKSSSPFFRPQQNRFWPRPFLTHQPKREESPAEYRESLFTL